MSVALLTTLREKFVPANQFSETGGLRVTGRQPLIKPGQAFEYESFAVLQTSGGAIQTLAEDEFLVEIPRFELHYPVSLVSVNDDKGFEGQKV